ncbi:hypothetical protein Tco_0889799, partial [Tanacetum coccineum]
MRRGKAISIDQGEFSRFSTCLFCNAPDDSSVCGDCLQQQFYSCEPSFYDTGDCEGPSSQILSTDVNDVPLSTIVHMPFSPVQQHLVGTQNITRKNAIGSEIPLSKKLADDVYEPSTCGVSDRERVATQGTLPAEVCNTSVTGVMQHRYVTSCLGNSSANESVSQPFLAHGVPHLKNSCDGVAASPVRSNIWRGIRNRVVTDTSKQVVTNSFHTTDYESTPSDSSSQLPANIANCSDASAFGLEASYNLNALSYVPATSACINFRGSNIGAPHSASMCIRDDCLSRSSIRVRTPGVSRQRSPAMSYESCAFDRNVRRRLSYGHSTILAANIDAHFGHRNTDIAESSSAIVGGTSIDVSMPNRQCCFDLNRQRGLSRQRSSDPGGEGNRYIPTEMCEEDFRTRGVSRKRSPATSSRSGDFNINARRRLSSTQSNLTPTTLPANLRNRNTDVPELSFARAEGRRSSYVVIPQRILILATVAINVITVGIYFGMESDLKNIYAYNQMFAMMSLGAKTNDSVNRGREPYVFKVSRQVYHWIGSLCPEEGQPPCFLQLYIYGIHNKVGNRMHHFSKTDGGVNPEIVEHLIHILDEHNELLR